MSELEEKLENILGNPQAMAQIMALAQSLNQSGPAAGAGDGAQPQEPANAGTQPQKPANAGTQPQKPANAGTQPPNPAAAPALPPAPTGEEGGLGSLLGGLDLNMLSAAAGLLGQFNGGDDDRRVALLTALRPFVREQRYAKLDKAFQIARLSRLIRSGLDLFRAKKDGAQGEDSRREGTGHV